jgi:hypothetical protein
MPPKKKKQRKFTSQAQVKWAFANKKDFARKWAHRNIASSGRPFTRKLPKKRRGKRRSK